ncbi:unnamed protein product [Prunus armeniaca]
MRKPRKKKGNPISSWHWMKRLFVKKFFHFEYDIYLLRNGYKIALPNIMVSQEKMEEDVKEKETLMDVELIDDIVTHKMDEEIKEKQEIMPIETPIVVEDFPKDEEQQLDSFDIKGMDKYEV